MSDIADGLYTLTMSIDVVGQFVQIMKKMATVSHHAANLVSIAIKNSINVSGGVVPNMHTTVNVSQYVQVISWPMTVPKLVNHLAQLVCTDKDKPVFGIVQIL